MKLSEFSNSINQGRINLSIFTNGIVNTGGAPHCAFSLLISINSQSTQVPEINIGNAVDLWTDIADFLNGGAKHIGISADGGTPIFPLASTEIFDSEKLKKWRRLLSKHSYFMELKKSSLLSAFMRSEEEAPVTPFFSDSFLAETTNRHHFKVLAGLDAAAMETQINNINGSLWERQARYESINSKGLLDAKVISAQRRSPDAKSRKSIRSILNAILQHPRMARYYGLVHDFELPATDPFCTAYFTPGQAKTLSLSITDSATGSIIQQTTKCANTNANIKDIIKVHTVVDNAGGVKYYHGPADFGLSTMVPANIQWHTCNPDHQLNTRRVVAENYALAMREGRPFDWDEAKMAPLEGIFLNYLNGRNPTAQPDPTCAWGLLGHNIAVAINQNNNADNLFSLCRRKVKYDPVVGFPINNFEEEGWIHVAAQINGVNQTFEANTIFNWTGHNLCVRKPGAKMDQRLNEGEEPGGLAGIFENDENEVIKTDAFSYEYQLAKMKDVQLISDNTYHFLIRMVLGNGYVMPLKPVAGRESELTLADLISRQLLNANKWFSFSGFSFDDEVINAPSILSAKVYTQKGNKSPESANHIVIEDGQAARQSRWVFPPLLSFIQAQFYGLFTLAKLKANAGNFVTKAIATAQRSARALPVPPVTTGLVNYLADMRGERLLLTPMDWFTRNLFLNRPGGGLHFEMSDYFDYSQVYDRTQAGQLHLKRSAATDFDIREVDSNEIDLLLRAGMQARMQIQLQEKTARATDVKTFTIPESVMQNVNLTNTNQPKYRKAPLFLTHAVSRPPVPAFANQAPVIRPTRPADIGRIFFSFRMPSYNHYAIKSLQLLTGYTRMFDDGSTIPKQSTINSHRNTWETANRGTLLENEVPSSVFTQSASNIAEKGVYKNKFGFQFRLTGTDGNLKAGDELIGFDIGTEISCQVLFQSASTASLIFKTKSFISKPLAISYAANAQKKLLFTYKMVTAGDSRSLKLEITNEANQVLPFVGLDDKPYTSIEETPGLPHEDLNYLKLKLNANVEQKLLDPAFSSAAFRFVYDDDYFIYKDEASADFLIKNFTLKATSRFEDYFPGLAKDKLVATSATPLPVTIPNNIVATQPGFQLVPLLYHEKTLREHQRSMMIMFEIERPLRNDEKFALILGRGATPAAALPAPDTCAIGRDFTTAGNDFLTAARPNGMLLSDFVLVNPVQPYLKKYFPANPIRTVNGYQVMILEPFFEHVKNKWIAVVSLDQSMMKQLAISAGRLLNAYNPFVKIVAAKYTETSTDGNHLSTLSLPKYMNILTERAISVNRVAVAGRNVWQTRIRNFAQAKFNSDASSRTRYVVSVRRPGQNGISGDFVLSRQLQADGQLSDARKYHVLTSDTINIGTVTNAVVCIYEFEVFDNTPAGNQLDWLNESTARLIYAEQFA